MSDTLSTRREHDWRVDDFWVVVILLLLLATVATAWKVGYEEGKHAADRWWQANWDNYARSGSHWHGQQCSTGCSSILGSYDPLPCGKDSVFMYPCPAKKVQAQSGKYSRLPYPVCMEDTGIGYGLVPIPCPKEHK